jgi:hypothetical protein
MRSIRVFLGAVLLLGLVGCASHEMGARSGYTGPPPQSYPSDYSQPMKSTQPGWQPAG